MTTDSKSQGHRVAESHGRRVAESQGRRALIYFATLRPCDLNFYSSSDSSPCAGNEIDQFLTSKVTPSI